MNFRGAIATQSPDDGYQSVNARRASDRVPGAIVLDDTDAMQKRRERMCIAVERAVPRLVQQWRHVARNSDSDLLTKEPLDFTTSLCVWASSAMDPSM